MLAPVFCRQTVWPFCVSINVIAFFMEVPEVPVHNDINQKTGAENLAPVSGLCCLKIYIVLPDVYFKNWDQLHSVRPEWQWSNEK